jgi:hypothetical protein
MSMRLWVGLILAVILAGLTGCGGYRLGPTRQLAVWERTIEVQLFRNETLEPRLTEAVATALRRELQQDGTYRLVTGEPGDIVVKGVLSGYERAGLSFLPGDVRMLRDMDLILRAEVTAVERLSGASLLERVVSGRTTIRMGPDLASAERQAVPLLAEELARNITALLVDGSW